MSGQTGVEKYESMEQKDFLQMSKEQWTDFLRALRGLSRVEDVEEFLRFHGLYAFLNFEDFCDVLRRAHGRCDLHDLVRALVSNAGFDIVISVELPWPGEGGRIDVLPYKEEARVIKILNKCPEYIDLIFDLMRTYGPAILIEANDGNTVSVFVIAKPRADEQ